MAGEHCIQIRPQGSKAQKTSDLRGQVRFKLMTASEDLVLPGNSKSTTQPVQMVYLIHFTAPCTNGEVRREFDGLQVFQVWRKINVSNFQ